MSETIGPYTFGETQRRIDGIYLTVSAMRRGIFVGDALIIKILDVREGAIFVNFFPLDRSFPNGFERRLYAFKKYQLHRDPQEGRELDVFLRPYYRYRAQLVNSLATI